MHVPIRLRGVVLNQLSKRTILPVLYDSYETSTTTTGRPNSHIQTQETGRQLVTQK
jgi:hypothetical protein